VTPSSFPDLVVTLVRTLCLASIVLLLTGYVSPADAQFVQGPPGSARGVFGGGGSASSSHLGVTFDLEGGYDDNTMQDAEAPPSPTQPFAPFQSGYVTTGSAAMRFQKGRIERYVLALGSGSVSQQQIGSGLPTFRIVRGEGSFQAATGQGRRSGATMSVGSSYEPTYLFGAFGSLDRNPDSVSPVEETPIATEDQSLALTEQRWLASRASAGAHYNWTPRQKLSGQYDGLWVQPIAGPGFESRTNSATVQHAWDPGPEAGLDLVYRYDDNAQVFDDGEQPLSLQTAEARVRYLHQLSPARSVSLLVGGGVVQLTAGAVGDTPSFEDVGPTASGAVRFDFARTWGLSFSARRDVTILNGLSAEPFASDSATLSIDGIVARRLLIAASGGYSRGRTLREVDGDFDVTLFNAQLRYGLGTHLGLVVRYSYDDQTLRNVNVSTSFPSQFSRNSVRVGVTMWLPLYGTF
jgi:hypothetical protein